MIFIYNRWEKFCQTLQKKGLTSIPAKEVEAGMRTYLVLKHDVETDVPKALRMARIEKKYGHRGSFYVQAYLMANPENIRILHEMQAMGHEISYHYDVMDSCKGDLNKAISEFSENTNVFFQNGFEIKTVCQHGNPIVERVGYTSNRDFFRSPIVRKLYPKMSDIMVNFKSDVPTDYVYFSDAGRKFKLIYDPLNNDVVNSEDRNVPYEDLNGVLCALTDEKGNIVSTHPHRWCESAIAYQTKALIFRFLKTTAKLVASIPFAKKIMSHYYYMAKKI